MVCDILNKQKSLLLSRQERVIFTERVILSYMYYIKRYSMFDGCS